MIVSLSTVLENEGIVLDSPNVIDRGRVMGTFSKSHLQELGKERNYHGPMEGKNPKAIV